MGSGRISSFFSGHYMLNSESLIFKACKEGKAHIVKFLIKNDFSVNEPNYKNCESCLDVSIRRGYNSILELIINSSQMSRSEVEVYTTKHLSFLCRTPAVLEIFYKFLAAESCKYRLKLWYLKVRYRPSR